MPAAWLAEARRIVNDPAAAAAHPLAAAMAWRILRGLPPLVVIRGGKS